MKMSLKKAGYGLTALLFLGALGFGQVHVEFTGFANYGLNLSFPQTMSIDSTFATNTGMYYDEWKTMFNTPVLEQKGGLGFGGRVAVQLSPMFAIEGTFEYGMTKFNLNAAAMTALNTKMADILYTQYTTFVPEGGHVLRIYGNLVLNFPMPGPFTPYLTAGIGTTSYTVEPSLAINRAGYDEHLDLHYNNISALTFNGGGGFKYFFNDMFGIRADARIFFGSPTYQQMFSYTIFGMDEIAAGNYVTQSGSQIDATVNVGIVIRIM